MRFLFAFICFFLTAIASVAQDSTLMQIETLPSEGVWLDKGWKFHEGDNMDFSKPELDDSKWQQVDPSKEIEEQPASMKNGICWLRLHIRMDSSLLDKQLMMMVKEVTASEIFLNGKLIHKFGTISLNQKEIRAYDPLGVPVSFPFDKNPNQVLAVRYIAEPNALYTQIFRARPVFSESRIANPLFSISINEVDASIIERQWRDRGLRASITFRIGAFSLLAVFYFAYYFHNKARKANLFFGIHAVLIILGDALGLIFSGEIRYLFFSQNSILASWDIANFFLLTALYSLLDQRRGWIYWTLTVCILTGIFLNALEFPAAIVSFIFSQFAITNLVNIEIVRTAFKAMKQKRNGAWIIVVGAIIFSIFWASFVLGASLFSYTNFRVTENYILGDFIYNLAHLSIPVATAIYMALDFAFTSKALELKLAEVEELSRKTIAQEQEKQQILSSQNETLEKQVADRTYELKQSLDHLKSTQSQLIQSEKMASLGELTAGIAHEIQNPLNFVNNFSEVNKELIEELKVEKLKVNRDEKVEDEILRDISENLEKINHHGKRADAIVKSMLQHSRKSSGQKELTDINALCDEYLRLAYHGLRAKDKSFNAKFETDFDPSLPKINVIPQDMGRVILNLINNAFYAVNERLRQAQPDSGFEPGVKVVTKNHGDKIEIRVIDNGKGIPEAIKEKIFQPFFTTKPTGQGTGLGLSLSYDIVKANGGELKMETKQGEGSIFIILLSLTVHP